MKESFLFSCLYLLSNNWVTHVVLWELEKWSGKLPFIYQPVFYLPNLCKHCAAVINSSVSQRTATHKKLGGCRWHFPWMLQGSPAAHHRARSPSIDTSVSHIVQNTIWRSKSEAAEVGQEAANMLCWFSYSEQNGGGEVEVVGLHVNIKLSNGGSTLLYFEVINEILLRTHGCLSATRISTRTWTFSELLFRFRMNFKGCKDLDTHLSPQARTQVGNLVPSTYFCSVWPTVQWFAFPWWEHKNQKVSHCDTPLSWSGKNKDTG